jgi:hypothetical protein
MRVTKAIFKFTFCRTCIQETESKRVNPARIERTLSAYVHGYSTKLLTPARIERTTLWRFQDWNHTLYH